MHRHIRTQFPKRDQWRRLPHDSPRGLYFGVLRAAVTEYYLADPLNPYQQSGRSSGAQRWEETRRCFVQALHRSGDFLDVGCAKGFLLHEFTRAVPGIEVAGLDISGYAIENAKEEVKPFLRVGNAVELPYPDKSFDLVVSINTLHNLRIYDLAKALRETERVSRSHKYLVVDGYRTEEEKANLMYWQITCESFFTPQEWEWVFQQTGYTGDYACIYYE